NLNGITLVESPVPDDGETLDPDPSSSSLVSIDTGSKLATPTLEPIGFEFSRIVSFEESLLLESVVLPDSVQPVIASKMTRMWFLKTCRIHHS
ncbi:MAG: hypothetical protein AABY86_10205, partial [Bdellovibrionota bacterium]